MRVLALVSLFVVVACDDPPPTTQAAAPVAAATQLAPVSAATAVARVVPAELTFREGPESRDPFRRLEVTPPIEPPPPEYDTRLPLHSLDRIQLTGIVGGRAQRRAMFRGPDGVSAVVKRGDRISSSHTKVKWILPDRVVLAVVTEVEGGRREGERVIRLHR
jgi:Tfp pilus assembly protein PilP